MSEMQSQKGWLFPESVDVPEQNWYRIDFGGDVQWDIDREGHEELARQAGMGSLTSEVAAHGVTDGIVYCMVESTLVIPEGQFAGEYTAIQGADTASQQVREPDYVSGVAESRALKRAVKRALGIRSAEADVSSDHSKKASDMFDGLPEEEGGDDADDAPQDEPVPVSNTSKVNDDQDGITW